MTPTQKDTLVASLVDDFNGAIKYTPMLADRATGAKLSDEELAKLRAEVFDTAQRLHGIAIDYLRTELKRSEYEGKTPEEIQKYLTTERDIDCGAGITFRAQPPITRVWHGIPYARNLPSIANIEEAMK